jgi:hypothetical protein
MHVSYTTTATSFPFRLFHSKNSEERNENPPRTAEMMNMRLITEL